eukprot:TRINITY_DN103200_c0_g1_i1.p1 TRINITY_DN103200_c0_g1~~TRINITY_DN103200_c0_g1_i1.p1  ORF type:complete len:637 (-),score=181.04 TRINITY_DN103200_c0_g1_i1:103-2013(-)
MGKKAVKKRSDQGAAPCPREKAASSSSVSWGGSSGRSEEDVDVVVERILKAGSPSALTCRLRRLKRAVLARCSALSSAFGCGRRRAGTATEGGSAEKPTNLRRFLPGFLACLAWLAVATSGLWLPDAVNDSVGSLRIIIQFAVLALAFCYLPVNSADRDRAIQDTGELSAAPPMQARLTPLEPTANDEAPPAAKEAAPALTALERARADLAAARQSGFADEIEEACDRAVDAGLASFEIDIARAEVKRLRVADAEAELERQRRRSGRRVEDAEAALLSAKRGISLEEARATIQLQARAAESQGAAATAKSTSPARESEASRSRRSAREGGGEERSAEARRQMRSEAKRQKAAIIALCAARLGKSAEELEAALSEAKAAGVDASEVEAAEKDLRRLRFSSDLNKLGTKPLSTLLAHVPTAATEKTDAAAATTEVRFQQQRERLEAAKAELTAAAAELSALNPAEDTDVVQAMSAASTTAQLTGAAIVTFTTPALQGQWSTPPPAGDRPVPAGRIVDGMAVQAQGGCWPAPAFHLSQRQQGQASAHYYQSGEEQTYTGPKTQLNSSAPEYTGTTGTEWSDGGYYDYGSYDDSADWHQQYDAHSGWHESGGDGWHGAVDDRTFRIIDPRTGEEFSTAAW